MKNLGDFKRGDTFAFFANIKDKNLEPISGMANNIKAQVRNSLDALVSELIVTEDEVLGRYLFKATETETWQEGMLYMDIQLNNNGSITSSETITLNVIMDVTK